MMLRKLLIIATVWVLIFMGLRGNGAEAETYTGDVVMSREDNINSTVMLHFTFVDRVGCGSGVIWDITEDGILVILTAKHCVEYNEPVKVEVVFDNKERSEVTEFYMNSESDFAFIIMDTSGISEEAMAILNVVKYDKNVTDDCGDEVYTIGKHYEKGLLYFSGKCLTYNFGTVFGAMEKNRVFSTNYPVIQGTSGGGVYNEEGYIIGICSTGDDDSSRYVGIAEIIEYYETDLK